MLFVIILAIALALFLLFRRNGWVQGRKPCRWVLVDNRRQLMEFRCETCKVSAYSQSRSGPQECKRQLRSSL